MLEYMTKSGTESRSVQLARALTDIVPGVALATIAAIAMGSAFGASSAYAGDLFSPSFQVAAPTLSAGGATGLTNPGPGITDSAGTTLGQSQPIGVSTGPGTGIELEMGFWYTVDAVPEPATGLGLSAGALTLIALRRLRASGVRVDRG